ncbi:5-formyltetrahydrofolate cyclo-ligase [Helicobacter pylori]|uniref:5-formyltetrahydrofolate cyclo-ligase n=1 Tax=Helicobacter pylori TaxID=210 RepID=UPI00112B87BB|nr:5-formyltetrahydrofolate cyclo-ligase [Helicobacter pylori]TPH72989.1 5-formyltetrahydrofolate cyclo-ligase [Helicobacter pylori]
MFRDFCKERLKRAKPTKNKAVRDKLACKLLFWKLKDYQNILLYSPLGHELDIRPLILKLRQKNKRVWLPKSIKKGANFSKEGFTIAPFRLPLRRLGWFDEPSLSHYYKRKLDCIVVPILGMDTSFRRVGFGLGMYDRSLPPLLQLKRPLIVFVSRELAIANGVLTDAYDIEADLYMNARIVMKNNKRKHYEHGVNLHFIRSLGSVFDYRSSHVLCDEKDLLR